jgi:hypothetical protein
MIDVINELFNTTFDSNSQYRQFPNGEVAQFDNLNGMESQHHTYWDDTYKVKAYTELYGQHLFQTMMTFKNAGNIYLNDIWIDTKTKNGHMYFQFKMIPGSDLLFSLINNFSIDFAVDSIVAAYQAIESNAACQIGNKYIIAHDYKLFNAINYNGNIVCFDYDRFSTVENLSSLYSEFWHKVEVDDLGAIALCIDASIQQQILKSSHERISKLSK